MKQKINVVIVDDHPLILQGFASMLQNDGGFNICFQANSIEDAEKFLHDNNGGLENLVVIVDLQIKGTLSFDFIKSLSLRKIKSIVYSMYESAAFVVRATQCGAKGYIFKTASQKELCTAIRKIAEGKEYLPPSILAEFTHTASVFAMFTPKELAIAQFVMEEKDNTQIAQLMKVKPRTVENNLINIYDKCGVTNRFELAQFLRGKK